MTAAQGALERLQARGRFGVRLGLGRTRALLRAMGDPQAGLPGALIGGTNGKGSTQAMVAAMLREAGFHVGQTPKPHLVDYRERIVVDGEPISAEDLDALLAEVLRAADTIEARHGPATEFELLTVAAFTHLARVGVAVAVIEVGLGGRLDATNVWDGGVAAITNVGLDHQEYLGTTVAAIAREKAAIIKRGDRAVSGATGDAARIIAGRARRLAVPLDEVRALEVVRQMDLDGQTLHHPTVGPLHLGLLGRHQAHNAAVALAIVDALAAAGIATVPAHAARSGLASVRWPGRLEVIPVADSVALLDGAHNPDGVMALVAALDELRSHLPQGTPSLLLGMLRDKDVDEMLAPLAAWADRSRAHVVVTTVPGTDRSLDAVELAQAWDKSGTPPARAIEEVDRALDAAMAAGTGPTVVCGSLYLVGHVRARLMASREP